MYEYVGPTWALKSFDPPGAAETNFAKEWKLPCIPKIFPSVPPATIADRLKAQPLKFPIVWVYSDPWGDIPRLTGIELNDFVARADWFDIWRDANQKVLHKINSLGVPVFLIGAHCDIIDCNFSNITVGHSSWQKFMAQELDCVKDNTIIIDNRPVSHCIAQEIYFRFFHENPEITPALTLKDLVIDQWILWDKFHHRGLMYDHHPTAASYKKFAEHLKPGVQQWLTQQHTIYA